MTLTYEPHYVRTLAGLPAERRERVERAVALLYQSQGRHPGLRTKRIRSQAGIGLCEARVNGKGRIFYTITHGVLCLYGYSEDHSYLKSPSRKRWRKA